MSWIALLLIGFGLSDLIFSARPMRVVPEASAAIAVILLGLASGLTSARDVLALVVIAGAVAGWGQLVTRGFGSGQAWWPLALFAGSMVVAIAASPYAGSADGWLGDWLGETPLQVLSQVTPDDALTLVGVVLLQMSTGNVLVRLVLAVTDTVNPARRTRVGADAEAADHGRDDLRPLKGGRLLGPMERLFILGLGLAGQLTAASIVVAAKGLLRWPELQAARDEPGAAGIHEVTEYFLVGSFASWLIALGSLILLA